MLTGVTQVLTTGRQNKIVRAVIIQLPEPIPLHQKVVLQEPVLLQHLRATAHLQEVVHQEVIVVLRGAIVRLPEAAVRVAAVVVAVLEEGLLQVQEVAEEDSY